MKFDLKDNERTVFFLPSQPVPKLPITGFFQINFLLEIWGGG